MKNSIRKILLVIFIMTIILSTASYASVESSLYLQYYNAYITKSGNTVNIHFIVQGTSRMDHVGVTEIYLYERDNSYSSWTPVQTYLSSDSTYTNSMMGSNTSTKIDSVSYSGSASKEYRAYVTCYAEKNGGSDSKDILAYE